MIVNGLFVPSSKYPGFQVRVTRLPTCLMAIVLLYPFISLAAPQLHRSLAPLVDGADLQVLSIDRTPRYPRYAPMYSYYIETEANGFGPYTFSAATGLGEGQTETTQRWPNPGDTVTYTAYVRNRGGARWTGDLLAAWRVNDALIASQSQFVDLEPGAVVTFAVEVQWTTGSYDITFVLELADARPENNAVTVNSKSAAFLTFVDQGMIENFRSNTYRFPQARTDDIFDWLNNHIARFNDLFASSGSPKRVHYGILLPVADSEPDPDVDRAAYAIFPFRYRTSDPDPRGSGYYSETDDIDYGLLHEWGHQLGLIDIYRVNVDGAQNQASGRPYRAVPCLMNGVSPFLSRFSAVAMTAWRDVAHGYYGQYMYNLPTTIRLRLMGRDGQPLRGAIVKMYQLCERPGIGQVLAAQVKAQGTTDANGLFILPNVPVDQTKVPPVCTGDALRDNPFGYVDVTGSNGVLHFQIEYDGEVDWCWLDITECMVAFFDGHTDTATFDRVLGLGGPIQNSPPEDMAELNAADWTAWAEGFARVGVYDDATRKLVGTASIRFETDGGFDSYLRYPGTMRAQWDLSEAVILNFSVYAENSNLGFQNGSPWIRLTDKKGHYYQYQYFVNGAPYDLLNEAIGRWVSFSVPINAPHNADNGWRRIAFGDPDLSCVASIEFHADTWGYGFTLWLDGVGFMFSTFYDEDFEDSAGWTTTGLWNFRSDGCVSCSGLGGKYAYFGGEETCTYELLSRWGSSTRSQGILTSPVISVPAKAALTLEFDFFREVEDSKRSTLDRTYVQIRFGRESRGRITWGGWRTVWSRSSKDRSLECGTGRYSFSTGNSTHLQIRFVFDSVNGNNNRFRGWAVDNVVVKRRTGSGVPLEVADLGEGWDLNDESGLEGIRVLNTPNPIRDVHTTWFTVLGVDAEALRVEVYDLTGRLVWRAETEGNELPWHTEDLTGLPLANGVYLYVAYVKVGGTWVKTEVQKLVILR